MANGFFSETVQLIIGIVLVIVAIVLLIDFVVPFAKLFTGVIALLIGIYFIARARGKGTIIRVR